MGFSSLTVFGDSLIDAGNALALAEWYDGLPFTEPVDAALDRFSGCFKRRQVELHRVEGRSGLPGVQAQLLQMRHASVLPFNTRGAVGDQPIQPVQGYPPRALQVVHGSGVNKRWS